MQTMTSNVAPVHLHCPSSDSYSASPEYYLSRTVKFVKKLSFARDVGQVIKALEELQTDVEKYSDIIAANTF
jgi:hypothetical protein